MTTTQHPIATRAQAWRDTLTTIRAEPLRFCPAFPEVAKRWNAWWKFESDRPLIVAQAAKPGCNRWDKAFDLLDQPGEWIRVRRAQVEHTHLVGEALPVVRVDIGPVAMGAFLGAPLKFAAEDQTSWQDPIIESWDHAPSLELDPGNPWLKKVLRLLDAVASDARGEYLVCLPDLAGAIDVLANLRGPERLCMDLMEHRAAVTAAADRAVDAWEPVFVQMYDRVLGLGVGITQWVSCWADAPFTVSTCDFNALIGPTDFEEVCMPSLKAQARRTGLCVFHLDGVERHARTLADDPDITAVQYKPAAATPSALAALPMLRMFQKHRVPLFVECPLAEVKALAQELDPAGLAIRTGGFASPGEADALMAWRDRFFSR